MEEVEKGLLMGACVFVFLLAATIGSVVYQVSNEIQESAYIKGIQQRNVVMVWMTS